MYQATTMMMSTCYLAASQEHQAGDLIREVLAAGGAADKGRQDNTGTLHATDIRRVLT